MPTQRPTQDSHQHTPPRYMPFPHQHTHHAHAKQPRPATAPLCGSWDGWRCADTLEPVCDIVHCVLALQRSLFRSNPAVSDCVTKLSKARRLGLTDAEGWWGELEATHTKCVPPGHIRIPHHTTHASTPRTPHPTTCPATLKRPVLQPRRLASSLIYLRAHSIVCRA